MTDTGERHMTMTLKAKNGSLLGLLGLLVLPATSAYAAASDLRATAAAQGQLTHLLAAAERAGVVDVLAGAGPYTIFAPTDSAFGKLDAELQSYLEKPENADELKALVRAHIVPWRLLASDLEASGGEVRTVDGKRIVLTANGTLKAAGAIVIQSDILADNGVIHLVDGIIEPKL